MSESQDPVEARRNVRINADLNLVLTPAVVTTNVDSTGDPNHLWNLPPTHLTLPRHEVHVWRACLDLPEAGVQRLERTLSADELLRAQRFYFKEHRRRFTVARGLLRAMLGLYLATAPDQIRFCYNAYGKPFLLNRIIHFNLSHSGRMALYAFTSQREVGVDIERTRTDFDCEELAEIFYSERERATLRALPPDMKHRGFFNCWTRKEAFIKAIGEGVSFPLDQFDVTLAPGEPARLLSIRGDVQAAARWHVEALYNGKGYTAACVVEAPIGQLQRWEWMEAGAGIDDGALNENEETRDEESESWMF